MDDINRREVASAAGALLALGTLTGAKEAACPARLLNANTKVPPDFADGETPPKFAIVRRVDLEVSGDKFIIRFTGGSNRVSVPSASELQELLRNCATDMYKFDSTNKDTLWPKPKPNSNEDISSPISLTANENCWIIYILAKRDRWRFQNQGSPLTIEECKHLHYRNSRRVCKDGLMIEDNVIFDDCRVALFAALVEKRPDAKDYKDAVNLHLDFVVKREDIDDGIDMRVKVIIDPDIRNPGGSSL